ncbi:unnamed protein product [Protopolystoma xenopodis]|uniref:Uncharacterized protein n=1 Tax=Protopolystoma xenopodis TaxID=117903 RepID=A0A448WQB2_9PLAT|nr:unnamed protein product [Protopolystoma xenopodis]
MRLLRSTRFGRRRLQKKLFYRLLVPFGLDLVEKAELELRHHFQEVAACGQSVGPPLLWTPTSCLLGPNCGNGKTIIF